MDVFAVKVFFEQERRDAMVAWYWVVVALMAGCFVGWLLCALCTVFGDSDEPEQGNGRYFK